MLDLQEQTRKECRNEKSVSGGCWFGFDDGIWVYAQSALWDGGRDANDVL